MSHATPFHDPAAFAMLPRVEGLSAARDGSRLIAVVACPDAEGAAYLPSLWEVPLTEGAPLERLTEAGEAESSPAFLPDGSLLYLSSAGAPPEEGSRLWRLTPGGAREVVASSPGGLGGPVVAAVDGRVLAVATPPMGARSDDEARERLRLRDRRKVTAILHTGMPVRDFDHELGVTAARLVLIDPADGSVTDLLPEARTELNEASYDISEDARTVVTTWARRTPRGGTQQAVLVLDTAAGTRRVLLEEPGAAYDNLRLSPDGRRLAFVRNTPGTPEHNDLKDLCLLDLAEPDARPVTVEVGDLWAGTPCWSPDGGVLYVGGDLHGRGAVLAVDPAAAAVRRSLAGDASYSGLCATEGGTVFAVRSAIDAFPAPYRLCDTEAPSAPAALPSPTDGVRIPGRMCEVEAVAPDGATVRAWLCTPFDADEPSPVMLWIHGGPLTSFNNWNWRWTPWLAVARGYAVILPDPALSTGYGPAWAGRGWPDLGGPVWSDLSAVLDAVSARPEIDGDRAACLGASFGGYMANWIAGHTDRFRAIVTHAAPWALEQEHVTSDIAPLIHLMYGDPAEHGEWFARNSPDRFADRISTPMLVTHSSRDYRVPLTEALRLWWDLVRRHDGEPEDLPHRFLQFTGEGHWIYSPSGAEIWYTAVLDFCDQHVRGAGESAPPLL